MSIIWYNLWLFIFIAEKHRLTKISLAQDLLLVNDKALDTHTGTWPPMFLLLGTLFSLLPSTYSFVTPNFLMTRKTKIKVGCPDVEEIRVKCKPLRFSYFTYSISIWWGWVKNLLNLRQHSKNSPTSGRTPQSSPHWAIYRISGLLQYRFLGFIPDLYNSRCGTWVFLCLKNCTDDFSVGWPTF